MFIETKEGQTHATCEEQLRKYGGKAKCCLCNVHDGCPIANSKGMFSPHEMTKAIKHAGKYMKNEQDKVLKKPKVIVLKRPPVPDEFCPECLSLKRKPNKECKNHDSYWIKTNEIRNAIDSVSVLMVKNIANKHIKVQDTHEGKSHQRHWYLVAQKMLKKLMKEYEKVCKDAYK